MFFLTKRNKKEYHTKQIKYKKMKKKGNKAVQKNKIIPELVEVKVSNAALTMSPTNGKSGGNHILQEVEKHVVSANKDDTVHNEKKEIPLKQMHREFYCTRTIVPAVMILAIHRLL